MFDWYTALPLAEQLFAGVALGCGALLTVLMLASVVGGDVDVDADVDIDAGAFSLKGILAFLAFFGFGAWIMLRAGSPVWLSAAVGVGTGYAMMSVLAYVLSRLLGLDADGGRRAGNLLAQEGEVYLAIPAAGEGVGRLQVRQGGRLVEVKAEATDEPIASGRRARVVEVLAPGRVRVEPLGGTVAGSREGFLT